MKKFLCLLGAIAFVFTSCSKDDNDSSDSTSSILVKKITFTESDGITYSEDITYNGNKIVCITGEDYLIKYTYAGDLITKMEEIDENGELDILTDYSYTNGKLTTSIRKEIGAPSYDRIKYEYNSDGTISYKKSIINTETEEEYYTLRTGVLIFKNGRLIKNEYLEGIEHSIIFEYDEKNNPRKNIVGFDMLLDIENYQGSVNNIVKQTHISGSLENLHIYTITSNYKYDDKNFPIEQVNTSDDSTSEITKYSY